MLNIEYYKDKLVELGIIDFDKLAVIHGHPYICDDIGYSNCSKCLFSQNGSCNVGDLNWLLSEYEKPKVDWLKVKVDTPILVRDFESAKWVKRYFAKFADGKVYAWQDGATSWTADGKYNVNYWNFAKLAESEE